VGEAALLIVSIFPVQTSIWSGRELAQKSNATGSELYVKFWIFGGLKVFGTEFSSMFEIILSFLV
jgi:hypothetical protein